MISAVLFISFFIFTYFYFSNAIAKSLTIISGVFYTLKYLYPPLVEPVVFSS